MAEEVKQNTPENTAQQVLAENSTEQPQEVAATTEEQPAVTETPDVTSIVNKTLQDFMGKEQGRLAQVSGQKIAAVEKSPHLPLHAIKSIYKSIIFFAFIEQACF